ncbi:MAG: BLUF domain-containing protein [Pseudomonadota bacterium]
MLWVVADYTRIMRQVMYESTASEELGHGNVFGIVAKSSARNAADDLSGFLLFHEGRFLQLLEGEAEPLRATLERVKRDPRHDDLKMLYDVEISERSFPKWTMRRISTSDADAAMIFVAGQHEGVLDPRIRTALERFLGLESVPAGSRPSSRLSR